jgi:hypothetical protein
MYTNLFFRTAKFSRFDHSCVTPNIVCSFTSHLINPQTSATPTVTMVARLCSIIFTHLSTLPLVSRKAAGGVRGGNYEVIIETVASLYIMRTVSAHALWWAVNFYNFLLPREVEVLRPLRVPQMKQTTNEPRCRLVSLFCSPDHGDDPVAYCVMNRFWTFSSQVLLSGCVGLPM